MRLILRCRFSNYFSHFFPAMKKKTKQFQSSAKRSRFTAVFCSNLSIIWACIVLIFQIISIGTTMWYVRQDEIIKYVHGGLWNICMGEINRTFCSYRSYTPGKKFLYLTDLQNDTFEKADFQINHDQLGYFSNLLLMGRSSKTTFYRMWGKL